MMAARHYYGALGDIMDEIAWKKKRVRGPYNVADYMQEVAAGGPKGGAFSDYYLEKARPTTDTLERFCKAFEVTEEERWKLAWAYAFPNRPRPTA